jgi:hypothetical protein
VGLLLLPAFVLGAIVRVVPVLTSDFPLHDGGLFLVMVEDIERNGFALPAYTTYNFDAIPFAYPPLALYLAAALHHIGLDLVAVLRWLPPIMSSLTVLLVYVVSRELLGSWRLAAASALVYALIPRSYEWLVIGGGLTRSLGMLFALIAIWQGIRLFGRPTVLHVVITGVSGGLAVLTHPEAALFVAVTLAVFIASFGRYKRQISALIAAGIIGGLVALPWWFTVISTHGIDAVAGAAGSRTAIIGSALREFFFGHFTGATSLDIFLGVGFVGLLVQLGRRRLLLPGWLLAVSVIILGAGFTFAMVPWAMLVAIAVLEVVLPAAGRLVPARTWAQPIVVTGLLGAGVLSSLATGYSEATPMHGLSREDRDAMAWVDAHTAQNARFAVVTGLDWWNDATSEWFPAIARRQSVATAQGYEWTDRFSQKRVAHLLLQDVCAPRLAQCILAWEGELGVSADYVYVPKGHLAGLASPADCCPALRESLIDGFPVVYDGPGATIVKLPDAAN